jgi:SET domain-containing protein
LSILLNYHIISTTYTPIELKNSPIELRKSPIHNRGIFAKRNIYKNEIIEIVPLLYIDPKEVTLKKNNPDAQLVDYTILVDNTKIAIMLGLGSLYNHIDDNNAEWILNTDNDTDYINNSIIIHAIKDINKDEEVFVNYGEQYWNARKDLVKHTCTTI